MEAAWNCSASERVGELQEQVVEAQGFNLGGQRHQLIEVRRGQCQRVVILLGDVIQIPGGCGRRSAENTAAALDRHGRGGQRSGVRAAQDQRPFCPVPGFDGQCDKGSSVRALLGDGHHIEPELLADSFEQILGCYLDRCVYGFSRVGVVEIQPQGSLVNKGLFVPVEHYLAPQLEPSLRADLYAAHGRLAGGAQNAFGFVGSVGALGDLGFLAGQLHGERQAGIGAALLAVGGREELLNLQTSESHDQRVEG